MFPGIWGPWTASPPNRQAQPQQPCVRRVACSIIFTEAATGPQPHTSGSAGGRSGPDVPQVSGTGTDFWYESASLNVPRSNSRCSGTLLMRQVQYVGHVLREGQRFPSPARI